MKPSDFIHFHVHTAEGSLLDGFSKAEDLAKRAKELGMSALAVTDHGTMYGAVKFYKACKREGIKPIIGCEVYLADSSMDIKEDGENGNTHLVLLCKNEKGYKNLIKMVSESYMRGFYRKPRIDHKLLRERSEGLICLSGCLAGKIQRLIVKGEYEKAKEEALALRDIFGEDFYLELQNHHLPEDDPCIRGQIRLALETGISYVCTNDCHYALKEDADAQNVAVCLALKKTESEGYRELAGEEFYLKAGEEMSACFPSDVFGPAVENGLKIAADCEFDFEFGKYHIPSFPVPEGFESAEAYFTRLCEKGFKERYGRRATGKALRERLETEMNIIRSMGYVEYFLIVWDFINYAKSRGIPVGPGRGSAAGSVVSYCLGITGLDPVSNGLIFERFLNPERVSMPDIDIDFCPERREEVINYVSEKYGRECVSRIITFNVLKAKSAVKDVARYYETDFARATALSEKIPEDAGSIKEILEEEESELKFEYDNDPEVKKIVDTAMKLEGLPRHASAHAAGVVISGEPISGLVPLYRSQRMNEPVCQYNMTETEELGLLKMDFLGLRNLTVIDDTVKMIKENHGIDLDPDKIPMDDKEVYKLLSKGRTVGIFQLEAKGITGFFKKLKPSCFEDVVAGVALYRPGPMDSIPKYLKNKNHPERIEYATRKLKPIYEMTYGCLIYQEQVLRVLMELAGYSPGQADLVRRAMSKKKKEAMDEHREYFINGKKDDKGNTEIAGCLANGVSEKAAREIWEDMASFARYAFNKSHAAVYSVITYRTAYLKKYYPAEFMAALMSSESEKSDKLKIFTEEAKRLRLKVKSPDVLTSKGKFTAKGKTILFGLDGIKNVGSELIEKIEERQEVLRSMENLNLFTFARQVACSGLNSKSLGSLISSSACDGLVENKRTGHGLCEAVLEDVRRGRKYEGQLSMFEMEGVGEELTKAVYTYKVKEEYTDAELLQLEKDCLGFYLSKHPLAEFKDVIRDAEAVSMEGLEELFDRGSEEAVTVAGIVTKRKVITTRTGKRMAFLLIEDETGERAVTVFPELYAVKSSVFSKVGELVGIRCRPSYSRGQSDLIAENLVPIRQADTLNPDFKREIRRIVKIRVEEKEELYDIGSVCRRFPGTAEVFCYVGDDMTRFSFSAGIYPSAVALDELRALAGRENVKYEIRAVKERGNAGSS